MSAARPLKVLFVSHQGRLTGGADRSLYRLVTGLDRRQFEPVVLAPRRDSLVKALAEHGISCLVIPYRAWIGRAGDWLGVIYRSLVNTAALTRLAGQVRQGDFDLIYTNTLYSPVGALLAARLGIVHIWHIREAVEQGLNRRYDRGRARSMRLVAVSRRVIANSRAVLQEIQDYLPSDQCMVIYNGTLTATDFDEPRHEHPHPNQARLVVVGAVADYKGQIDAVKAAGLLREWGITARLRLVGAADPAYAQEIQTWAARLGIAGDVRLDGFVDAVKTVYREADINLVCTRYEGFGLVIPEAMAAGCPTIATASGGIPEIIDDGSTGLLYPAGDYAALAGQIRRLITDPSLYQAVSQQGQQAARERFTAERYVDEIQAVMRDVCRG